VEHSLCSYIPQYVTVDSGLTITQYTAYFNMRLQHFIAIRHLSQRKCTVVHQIGALFDVAKFPSYYRSLSDIGHGHMMWFSVALSRVIHFNVQSLPTPAVGRI